MYVELVLFLEGNARENSEERNDIERFAGRAGDVGGVAKAVP